MRWWRKRRRWASDQEATAGADAIESAANWARHVFERDFQGADLSRAVMVVECVREDGRVFPFYAGSEINLSPVALIGLLNVAIDMARGTAEDQRTARIVDAVGEKLLEEMERRFPEPPSAEDGREVTEGLLDGPARLVTPEGAQNGGVA